MKKIILLLMAVFITSTGLLSQSQDDEMKYYQALFGMEKMLVVAQFTEKPMDDIFWEAYEEYEVSRKNLGTNRINLLEEYAENYETLSDEKLESIMKDVMKLNKNLDKLISKYYKKIKKSSGVKVATQFYQLENYFLSAIRLEIWSAIPFIGEFE